LPTFSDVAPSVSVSSTTGSAENVSSAGASGSFSDYDDAVIISQVSGPAGTISQSSGTSGTWSWAQSAALDEGSYTVVIRATNADSNATDTSFTFTVSDVAPSVSVTSSTGSAENVSSAGASGSFSDYDDAVTISQVSGPAGTISQSSGTSGTWSWAQSAALDEGSYTVVIRATNAEGRK